MAKHHCKNCGFRARYDRNPRSLMGRLWRWHAGWCPGWRAYLASLPAEERQRLALKSRLKARTEDRP
jgi:hypothetical protein